ncbi:hypothetical protein, partial [Chlorobium phaeovibrioides]|uniref:hypothetical protein n=1 Tax=Chlorobium phaeovibrioides TaxID=1094 RepID=UPI001C8B493C
KFPAVEQLIGNEVHAPGLIRSNGLYFFYSVLPTAISARALRSCRFRPTSNTNSAEHRTVIPRNLEQVFRSNFERF